jgi:zinc protease
MKQLLLALLVTGFAIPAAAAPDRYPSTTTIENVPAQVDMNSALAGVQVLLPGGLDRQTSQQNGYAALLGEVVSATPVTSAGQQVPLRSAISGLGASLTVNVEPENVQYYVEGPPAALRTALGLLGTALAAPDFSPATLTDAKRALEDRIIDADESPFGVLSEMLRRAYYPGSGTGYAPLGSRAVVATATSAALRKFWSDNYKSGGASLAGAGRVDADVARAASAVIARLPAGTPAALTVQAEAPMDPPARIVTHRDVALPWVGMGFAAPAAGTKDFAAMLVVQAIYMSLGRTDSIVSQPAALRPINAVYQYDVRPANFIIYSSGNGIGAAAGWQLVPHATDLLDSKPLDPAVMQRYKTLAIGQFVIDNMTLEDRSALVGWVERMGLDPDYPNTVLAAIDAVTPEDVQRVVKTYMHKYRIALILPRPTQEER